MSGARHTLALLLALYLGLSSAAVILPNRNDGPMPNSDDLFLAQPRPDLPLDDFEPYPEPEPEPDRRCVDGTSVDGTTWWEEDCYYTNGNFEGVCNCWCEGVGSDYLCHLMRTIRVNCSYECLEENDWICGSNDVSYQNPCKLNVAACQAPEEYIARKHEGRCHDNVAVVTPMPTGSGITYYPSMGVDPGRLAQRIPTEHNYCKYTVGSAVKYGTYNKDCNMCENCHEKCQTGEFNAGLCECKTTPICK